MEEIKVGEYVRTKYGIITKLKEIDARFYWFDKVIYYDDIDFLAEDELKKYILNHNPNIIDLIQKGDYVNEKKISNVDKFDNTNVIEWEDGDIYKTTIQNDNFIKSIVTKEQFESIKYEV